MTARTAPNDLAACRNSSTGASAPAAAAAGAPVAPTASPPSRAWGAPAPGSGSPVGVDPRLILTRSQGFGHLMERFNCRLVSDRARWSVKGANGSWSSRYAPPGRARDVKNVSTRAHSQRPEPRRLCLLERLRLCLLERLRLCLLERLRRGARTHQVAVTVGLIDPAHRRPVLRPPVSPGRVRGGLPVVGVLPVAADQHARGVRRV